MIKKSIIILFLAILVSGGVFYSKTNKPVTDDNWKTYKNDKYGFEFKYPLSWRIKENKDKVYGDDPIVTLINPDYVGKPETDQPTESMGIYLNSAYVCPVVENGNKKITLGSLSALDSGWVSSISNYRNLCFSNGFGIHLSEVSGDYGQKTFMGILKTLKFSNILPA